MIPIAEVPTLLVSRRPRVTGTDWAGARSWLGGAPRLGAAPWPRGTWGEPLPFAAQIDLAEVAAATGGGPLPATGSLAFFIGRGAVIHVPEGADAAPCDPPDDGPDLERHGGARYWSRDLDGRRLFPFWPVRLTTLTVPPFPGDEEEDEVYDARVRACRAAQVAAVEAHHRRRLYNLSAEEVFAGAPRQVWWHSAATFADRLDEAVRRGVADRARTERATREDELAYLHARLAPLRSRDPLASVRRLLPRTRREIAGIETNLAEIEAEIAQACAADAPFSAFRDEVVAWAKGRDPWERMEPAEIARLTAALTRANREFDRRIGSLVPHSMEALETDTLLNMASGPDRAYAALPENAREIVNREGCLPAERWHQMFGYGVEIQGHAAAMREMDKVLLLQIVADDVMRWSFGDCGVYCFWIDPEDLARQDWTAATVTIECH